MTAGVVVALAPDLFDRFDVLAPDAARAELEARILALPDAERDVAVGERAMETAARLRERRPARVLVVGGPADGRAMALLAQAVAAEGLPVDRLAPGEAPEFVAPRVEGAPARPCDAVLVDVPAEFASDAEASRVKAAVEDAVAAHGAARVRLRVRTPSRFDPVSSSPSPLPPVWGFADPRRREWIRALVDAHWPSQAARVRWLLGSAAIGVNPLEQMYAGNHLRDRNAELLVNVT